MPVSPGVKGALMGLGAEPLFGLSAPIAKLLLPSSSPLVLASLLYPGSGLGLATMSAVLRRLRPGAPQREARLGRKDVPLLAGIMLCGGIVGPVLMLTGLARLSGVAASLLLNLEGPFTILLALLVFGDTWGAQERSPPGSSSAARPSWAPRPGRYAGMCSAPSPSPARASPGPWTTTSPSGCP